MCASLDRNVYHVSIPNELQVWKFITIIDFDFVIKSKKCFWWCHWEDQVKKPFCYMLCKFRMCSFALHKSRCSTVNRSIYSNMSEFWLLPQLFQDISNAVFQHDREPSSDPHAARCQHSWTSHCLSNGPAEEGPLPDLPSLTTSNFFVKCEVYIWPM
jgi:hypothetical protein